ncbi:MAG: UPF0104 family protein [Gammaproteobacteria bacterium]|nr:UPF0104 family protein [Gammaproteobacteria bacterium]
MKARLLRWLPALASIVVIVLAGFVLWREVRNVRPNEVMAAFATIPAQSLLLAGLLTAVAWLALALYEVRMLRYLRPRTGWRRPFVTALIAYPLGHAIGFGAFSGGAIRYRLYTAAGFTAADVGRLIVLSVMPYAAGVGLLASVALLTDPVTTGLAVGIDAAIVLAGGGVLLLLHGAYVALVLRRVRPFGRWWPAFVLPSPGLTAAQYLFGACEILGAVATLYVLLPPAAEIGFATFLAVYVAAVLAGALSGVPAGLGVFESVLFLAFRELPAGALLGMVLAYRLVYELIPFVFGLLLLLAYEAWSPRARPR